MDVRPPRPQAAPTASTQPATPDVSLANPTVHKAPTDEVIPAAELAPTKPAESSHTPTALANQSPEEEEAAQPPVAPKPKVSGQAPTGAIIGAVIIMILLSTITVGIYLYG